MAAMTGPAGMIPEQVWDGDSIPERRLLYGKPTGSAMPLAWAHAEFIKLFVSRHIGHPVDRPDAVWRRYQGRRPEVARTIWTLSAQISHVCSGSSLTIVVPRPARIHRGFDGWQNVKDVYTQPIGLDLHGVELAAAMLARAHTVDFTIQWRDTSAWIGSDFRISVERQRAR
jgi:glucoamylase